MENEIGEIADCLMNGGVVLIPTDTVYGLAVSPDFDEAVNRLYALKHRPRKMNLPIMVSSVSDLEPLGIDMNDCVKKLLQSPFVPGALTLALGFIDKPLVPWLAGREEVAIRIPNDTRMLEVLKITGPLLVTSANKHGLSTCSDVNGILIQLDGEPDKVIDGGILETVPSTLVNCRNEPPKIEREGCISGKDILKHIG